MADAVKTGDRIELSCQAEYQAYPYNEEQDCWSLVNLKAPCHEEDEESKRAPIDMVAVIDKSGSMAGEKLKLVKLTLEFVLKQLKEDDRLSIVTYDDHVYVDFQLSKMSKGNREEALGRIKRIRDGSCTNLCGGLLKGLCQVMDRGADKNDVASVLLFTDGLANQGITNKEGIIAAMRDPKRFDVPTANQAPQPAQSRNFFQGLFGGKSAKPEGDKPKQAEPEDTSNSAEASVYTFGFGADHNPDLLKAISDAGNGMYYYIENEDKIAESFGHCIGGLLSTAAQGIQLEVQTEDGVTIKKVHTERPVSLSDDKKNIRINIGDLQSEEERDLVIELTLNKVPAPLETSTQTLFNARVDYFNVTTKQLDTAITSLAVNRPSAVVRQPGEGSHAIDRQRNRVKVTDALRIASERADMDDLEGARALLNEEIRYIHSSKSANDELCQAMVEDINKCMSNYDNQRAWKSKGKKMQMNIMQSHGMQRAANISSKAYQSKAKSGMARKAKAYTEEE